MIVSNIKYFNFNNFMGIFIEVDNINFVSEVLKNFYRKLVLVDFYVIWCGLCKMLKLILEKLV